MCGLMEEDNFVVDDNAQPCYFTTTTHNPLENSKEGK